MKTIGTTLTVVLTFLSFILFSPPVQATKIGVVMDDHSGPEYYPAQPDGNQCVACDQGQPYTDGYNHSADGYFAMKYFMAHMVNINAAIPGFVAGDFGDQGDGIILMDKYQPETIVSGTPTLIDAWGKEGIYVSPAIPGADPVNGYITYTKLYTDFSDSDGTHRYIWPQPYPYPTGDPAYPANKKVMNDGNVAFYVIPRDVMNAYEDTTFNGGAYGYGPYSLPAGALYLEGPIEEPAGSGHFYPDNGWKNMLGWVYDLNALDFIGSITDSHIVNAWEENDFYEFAGLDTYTSWLRKGGREVYMEEVTGQMNQVKDWLWAHYNNVLTGGASGNKDDYIRVTYMIDPCFCNGENPADNIHGKSLYNAVYDLITRVGVDKIVVHDHFILQSQMMNDDMGWHMMMMAVDDAHMNTGSTFDMDNDMLFAPGHTNLMADDIAAGMTDMDMLNASPFKDYYLKNYNLGSKPIRKLATCGGFAGPTWDNPPASPPYPDKYIKNMWVGGVALRPEYIAEVVTKAVSELNWAVSKGAADIALFMSNHGTPTEPSWCYDTTNDYLHYNNKLAFIRSTEAILNSSSFTSSFGSIASKNYEPYALSNAEITDLADLSDNNDLLILDHDIQVCKVVLSTGKKIVFYRVSGQNAYDSSDKMHLVYSPREAIDNILTVLNPAGWNVTHVVDLLYNFMGQSGDLLWDQRIKGYGEAHDACPGSHGTLSAQVCAEEKYLENLALVYSNPIIDDASNPNSWKNFLSIPEQLCYPPDAPYSGNPCWDFGHDNPSCPNSAPEGCYVSYFSVYDSPSTPIPPGAVVPAGGLKLKITNGSWGWDGKVQASRSIISEALDQYFGGPTKVCPMVMLLGGETEKVKVLREFRDRVLMKTPEGRAYVTLFYRHSLELTAIILRNPSIATKSKTVLNTMLSKAKDAVTGNKLVVTQQQRDTIISLLNVFGKEASPALNTDIKTLLRDLSPGRIFEKLNIQTQNN